MTMTQEKKPYRNYSCPCKSSCCHRKTSCEKCMAYHHSKNSKTACGK